MGGVRDLGTSAGWSGLNIGGPNAGWCGRGAPTSVGTAGCKWGIAAMGATGRIPPIEVGMKLGPLMPGRTAGTRGTCSGGSL